MPRYGIKAGLAAGGDIFFFTSGFRGSAGEVGPAVVAVAWAAETGSEGTAGQPR